MFHEVSLVDKIFLNKVNLFRRVEVAIWHVVLKHIKIKSGNVSYFFVGKKILCVSIMIWRKLTEPNINLSKLFFIG
jgi:hypothetical protein